MIRKALRQGYYWSTMLKQATTFVRSTPPDCKIPLPHIELVLILGAWTYAHW